MCVVKRLLLFTILLSLALPAWARPVRHLSTLSNAQFTPKQFSGLIFWFDASDLSSLSLSGSNVTQWADKSGSGFNATQGTAINQPLTGGAINGKNALRFSNANQTYLLFNGSMKVNTMAVVWKYNTTPWANFLGVITARNSTAVLTSNGAYNAGMQGVASTTKICGLGQSTTGVWVDNVSAVAANFDTYLVGIGSAPLTTPHLFTYTDDVGASGAMYFAIGIDVFEAIRGLDGQIAEIVAYDRALSAGEISTLNRALKSKWGIA